jgi:drug/metabolite transporter (DMT)-like permease
MVHIFALVISHYYLSVAVIHTINSCGPIFVFIWDYFIYNITINRKQILGIAVGITGMLVTVNSDSLYLIIDGDY